RTRTYCHCRPLSLAVFARGILTFANGWPAWFNGNTRGERIPGEHMDLQTKADNQPVHQRLASLARELDDGASEYDLALAEIRNYQRCLQAHRLAMAEILRMTGYPHWVADPGSVVRVPWSI